MNILELWAIKINLIVLIFISSLIWIRRISGFRRVSRRLSTRFKRVNQYKRRIAKTDPKIYDAIYRSSHKSMKIVLDRKGSQWVNDKKIKKQVKKKVAIDIEKIIQTSPMRDMRSLINKTLDEMIDLALLKEVKERGTRLKITSSSPFGIIFWRIIIPIATAGIVGWISFTLPDLIPPGSLFIPSIPQLPTGAPGPIDPVPLIRSAIINGAIYGIGTLLVVRLVAQLKRR